MEGALNSGMCRCCASEGTFKDVSSKYQWMGEEEIYSEMLRDCFDITLTNAEDIHSGGICEVCITQLRNAANFKKQVLLTEEQFKRRLQDDAFKNDIIKIEVNALEDDDGNASDNNLSDDFSSPEYEVPIKMETEEKVKKRGKASASRAKKPKLESGDSSKSSLQTTLVASRKNVITIQPRPRIQLKKQTEIEKHQENILTILEHSNATPIRTKGSIGYACCYCSKEFPEAGDLKGHTLTVHDQKRSNFMKSHTLPKLLVKLDITSLQCNLCSFNFNLLEELVEHLKTKHNNPFHANLKNYVFPFKFDTEILKCVKCSKEFNNFKILLAHMHSHYQNEICEVCGEGFVNKAIMLRHWYRHKKGVFNCSHCNKVFDNNVKRKEHERAVHVSMNKRHKCGYCGEKFSDYTKKNDHVVKVHGAKPTVLNCQACNKTFDNQRALTSHTKSYHLLEGPVKKYKKKVKI